MTIAFSKLPADLGSTQPFNSLLNSCGSTLKVRSLHLVEVEVFLCLKISHSNISACSGNVKKVTMKAYLVSACSGKLDCIPISLSLIRDSTTTD